MIKHNPLWREARTHLYNAREAIAELGRKRKSEDTVELYAKIREVEEEMDEMAENLE